MDLLTKTADTLSLLKDPSTPQAYYSRLHLGMTWCVQVVSRVANSITTAPKIPLRESSSASFSASNDTGKTRTNKTPSLSTGSSSPSLAPPKMIRTPPPESSPRPRKKSLSSQTVNARVIPWAQKQVQKSTICAQTALHSGSIIPGGKTRETNAIEEEDPLFPDIPETSMPSLSTDFFDWGVHLLNGESMLPELNNIPDLNPGVGSQDTGMLGVVMPDGGCGMAVDPWDMEF